MVAEGGDGLAGGGVEGDQTGVYGGDEKAAVVITNPGGYAAIREIAPARLLIHLRIESPLLLAGLRLQGNHAAKRSGDEERVVRKKRCGFKGRLFASQPPFGTCIHVTGMERPGDGELIHVGTINACQRRILRAIVDLGVSRRPGRQGDQQRSQRR